MTRRYGAEPVDDRRGAQHRHARLVQAIRDRQDAENAGQDVRSYWHPP